MKPRAPELLAISLLCLLAVAAASFSNAQTAGGADFNATPPPLGAASPAEKSAHLSAKAARAAMAVDDTLDPVNNKQPKEIPLPLGVGHSANFLKIPEVNTAGQILTLIMAAKATRSDHEHVQMQEMKMDFYHPDGKEDFHIMLPASTLNLQTHVLTSSDPVTVRTADFELTGEQMEFNTLDRTGALDGHVHMVIHNFKQIANVPQPPSSHE